jgi:hypothetical protein
MQPTKQQMISALVPSVMQHNPGRSSNEVREFLSQMSDQDLEFAYNSLVPLDSATEAKIAVDADKAVQRQMLLLKIDQKNADKRTQREQQSRAQFADIARQLGISNCDTNFNIAYGLHPSVFNSEDIAQFIADGRLSFIPASPDELLETDLIQKVQIVEQVLDSLRGHVVKKIVGTDRGIPFDVFGQVSYGETPQQNRARQIKALLELSLAQLRQLHQRGVENQAVKQGRTVEHPPVPVDPNFNSGSGLDRANGGTYVPLPTKNGHGETIDAAYLVKLANRDMNLYKRLIRKHGYRHMTDRIKGIA